VHPPQPAWKGEAKWDGWNKVWKTRLAPREHRIPGNGRIISAWPVRSSVVLRDGTAYAGAGMFPSEGVYLYALDARTGAVKWQQIMTDMPAG